MTERVENRVSHSPYLNRAGPLLSNPIPILAHITNSYKITLFSSRYEGFLVANYHVRRSHVNRSNLTQPSFPRTNPKLRQYSPCGKALTTDKTLQFTSNGTHISHIGRRTAKENLNVSLDTLHSAHFPITLPIIMRPQHGQ